MKNSLIIILVSTVILAGCKSQQKVSSSENDDVYAPKGSKVTAVQSGTVIIEDLSAAKQISADSIAGNQPGSSTLENDYNDYSARIKRFSQPDQSKGYFDEAYTGSSGLDSAQESQDVNVYVSSGYNCCWDPGFSISFGYGWGYPYYGYYGYPYYWGYYPYYYDWWYYPWGGYPYYYGNYWSGYYDGYYNGYWDGYYGYPYDPNYYPSAYYGKRNTSSSGDLTGPVVNPRTENPVSQNEIAKSGRSTDAAKNDRTTVTPLTETRTNSSNITESSSPAYTRSTAETRKSSTTAGRTTSVQSNSQNDRYRYNRTSSQTTTKYQRSAVEATRVENQKPAPKYTRPASQSVQSRTATTETYSSPAYRQPKSSQEYINPNPPSSRTQSTSQQQQSGSSTNQINQQRQTGSAGNAVRQYNPPTQNRAYSKPSRTQPSQNYSSPSRSSSPNYSAPSRSSSPSYSAPSRSSSPSYSAPSRSGSSGYSTPSRSGGNSGGSSGGAGKRR